MQELKKTNLNKSKQGYDTSSREGTGERRSRRIYLTIAGAAAAVLILAGAFFYLRETPYYRQLLAVFSSQEAFREYIGGFERKAPVVFFLLQVVQVIVSPIPGALTTIAGGSLFGLIQGFILNTGAILLGSLIAYLLSRRFGKDLVIRLVGEEKFTKYYQTLTRKFGFFLLLIFLLPFFPDDVFCFLAGLSSLPLKAFLLLLVFGRIPVIFIQTLLGAQILKLGFEGWLVLIGILGILMYVLIKYKERIERVFLADN